MKRKDIEQHSRRCKYDYRASSDKLILECKAGDTHHAKHSTTFVQPQTLKQLIQLNMLTGLALADALRNSQSTKPFVETSNNSQSTKPFVGLSKYETLRRALKVRNPS